MKIGRHARGVGLESSEQVGNRMQQRQHHGAADYAIQQVPEREPAAGGIVAVAVAQAAVVCR